MAKGVVGFMGQPWEAAVMNELRASRDPVCAGMLPTLYVGNHLVAAHFGIRSRTVRHWCFPTDSARTHALATRLLSPRLDDLQRRAVNRLLRAGRSCAPSAAVGLFQGLAIEFQHSVDPALRG